jgi:acetolactate synthase-1/2/3 large subunit
MTDATPAAPVPGRTIADLLADGLVASGVDVAFTVPGESFLPLLDAVTARGIRVVATRHEGAAGFMADAWGQLTGRPAAVLVTRAVGAANAAIGLVTALADSAPVIMVVGQVRREVSGREAFQEADIVGSVGRLAKWAIEVRDPAVAPGAIEEALRRATDGRPGPVLLGIPEDVFDEPTADRRFEGAVRPADRRAPEPPLARVVAILKMLAAADRPVILAGAGVIRSRGTRDLVRLAETLEVPVIAGWRRGDVFPNDHRLYLGMAGFGSPPTVRERLAAADAVLVLGSRLNEVTTFGYTVPAAGTPWAHVDRAPREVTHDTGPAISLAADADAFLRAATRAIGGAVHEKARYDARRRTNAADRAAFMEASAIGAEEWDGFGVHPGRAIAALQAALPQNAVVTTDAGSFAGWLARGYRFRRPGTFLGPTSGAMGYALPAAIAAALHAPDRPAVAVAGDGGFAMTMAELETAVRCGLPVVAIVFDDRRYGMILDQQLRAGHARVGTDLGPVDFAGVARALGAHGATVERDEDLASAVADALRAGGPSVVHLRVDPRWLSVDRRMDVAAEPEAKAPMTEITAVVLDEAGAVQAVVAEAEAFVLDDAGDVAALVDETETVVLDGAGEVQAVITETETIMLDASGGVEGVIDETETVVVDDAGDLVIETETAVRDAGGEVLAESDTVAVVEPEAVPSDEDAPTGA